MSLHCWLNTFQKQLFSVILQNMCSWKFCKIYRKKSIPEYLFNKVVDFQHASSFKKRAQRRYFFMKFLKTYFLYNTFRWLYNLQFNLTQNTKQKVKIPYNFHPPRFPFLVLFQVLIEIFANGYLHCVVFESSVRITE